VGWTLAPRVGLGHGFRLINAIRCSRTAADAGAGRVLADVSQPVDGSVATDGWPCSSKRV